MVEITFDSSKKYFPLQHLLRGISKFFSLVYESSFSSERWNQWKGTEKIIEIFSITKLREEHLVVAVAYLDILYCQFPSLLHSTAKSNEKILEHFVVSLLLASKFMDDITFRNKTWSSLCTVSLSRINKLETEFLMMLNYSLYLEFDLFSVSRAQLRALLAAEPGAWSDGTCIMQNRWQERATPSSHAESVIWGSSKASRSI